MSTLKNNSTSKNLISTKTILISTSLTLFIIFLLNFPFTSNPLHSTIATTFTSQLLYFSNFTSPLSSLPNTSFITTTQNYSLPVIAPVYAAPSVYIAPSPSPSSLVENRSSLVSSPTASTTCDIFDGRWIFDDAHEPLYAPGSCPFVGGFDCFKSGRPDLGYLNYRWQPYGCDIPRFDKKKMMELLKGKKIVFIGDSLNRNMWTSLVCSLMSMFESDGKRANNRDGYFSYHFKDCNCDIIFVTAPFLVQRYELPPLPEEGWQREFLRLDTFHEVASRHFDADILLFNTGHWWNIGKVHNGENFFQEGDVVHKKMDLVKAYNIALNTWAAWVDKYVNKNKSQVFFVGYSAMHFKGGEWNYDGRCDRETEPITDEKLLGPYSWLMKNLESVMSKMSTPVVYLNISKLTEYRQDGHPSKYRRPGYNWRPGKPQDCVHWCLPGVPDTWNQLLYATLLPSSEGSGTIH